MSSLGRNEDEYVALRQQIDDNLRSFMAEPHSPAEKCKTEGGADYDRRVKETHELFEEASELMEAMELEASDSDTTARLREYKESARVAQERFMYIQAGCDRQELFDGGMGAADGVQAQTFEEQRAKIAAGEEKLKAAREEINETLKVAHGTMEDLHRQRDVINNIDRNTDRAAESMTRSENTIKRIRNHWTQWLGL